MLRPFSKLLKNQISRLYILQNSDLDARIAYGSRIALGRLIAGGGQDTSADWPSRTSGMNGDEDKAIAASPWRRDALFRVTVRSN